MEFQEVAHPPCMPWSLQVIKQIIWLILHHAFRKAVSRPGESSPLSIPVCHWKTDSQTRKACSYVPSDAGAQFKEADFNHRLNCVFFHFPPLTSYLCSTPWCIEKRCETVSQNTPVHPQVVSKSVPSLSELYLILHPPSIPGQTDV